MTDSKKIPQSWEKSNKNIRAVQVVFELEQPESQALRIKAIEKGLSPSDYIRDIIGLPRKKPVRPRLSVSLSEEDYEILAKRYHLKPDEKRLIRETIKQELVKNHQTK
ncbi:MAG: hypothetical protein KAH20_07080 [Methylococcales bacterium]|nr:hypothetical protein [Methylococcales bacterium]MCK5905555.1 hypothetical protein [Gammaproteobacteria bacterium]